MTKSRDFFTLEQQQELKTAIQLAEKNTSGEIRLHIDTSRPKEVFPRAFEVFNTLEISKTELKNGVLFYLSLESREFAVIGDAGINNLVPDDFWDDVRDLVISHFKKEEFVKGLIGGIKLCSFKLKEFFPYQREDVNELTDELSFGD